MAQAIALTRSPFAVTPLFSGRTGRPSLSHAFTVWQQRRSLAQLDNARLDDLGLTRADAQREAARPVWDLRS